MRRTRCLRSTPSEPATDRNGPKLTLKTSLSSFYKDRDTLGDESTTGPLLRASTRRSTTSSAALCSWYSMSVTRPCSRSVSSENSSSLSAAREPPCGVAPLPPLGTGSEPAGDRFNITPAPAASSKPRPPRIHHLYFAHGSFVPSGSIGLPSPPPGTRVGRR